MVLPLKNGIYFIASFSNFLLLSPPVGSEFRIDSCDCDKQQ